MGVENDPGQIRTSVPVSTSALYVVSNILPFMPQLWPKEVFLHNHKTGTSEILIDQFTAQQNLKQ